MKLKQILSLLLIAATMLVACNNTDDDKKVEKDDAPVVVKKAGEGERVVISTEKVPEPVMTTFETKYAKAEDVKWSIYRPVPADKWDTDKDYYYVTYKWNFIPYEVWYQPDGTVAREDELVYLPNSGDMPKAIVKSIMQHYPGYEIVEMDKENDKDMDMYEVELRKGEEKAKVKFLMNGEIFKAK